MTDLADFLKARIAETEAAARVWMSADPIWTPYVLAECDAKRRIVNEHAPIPCENERHQGGLHCAVCSYDDPQQEWYPCLTLRLVSLPYAKYPDYREEWRLMTRLADLDPQTGDDANGCPAEPHHGVDCPGDACRYAAPIPPNIFREDTR